MDSGRIFILIINSVNAQPDSHKFEALDLVRNGFKTINLGKVYKKCYNIAKVCAFTKNSLRQYFRKSILQRKHISPQLISLLTRL